MTINERFKQVRNALDKSQTAFGRPLNLTRDAVANIELNRTSIKPLTIDSLCDHYGVSQEWLITGEGKMFNRDTKAEEINSFFSGVSRLDDDNFKKRFALVLASLDEREWELLEEISEKLAEPK